MNTVIRCDASRAIGTGHVMRCLTLAEQLRGNGGEVTFISREHVGNMNDYIESRGYRLHRLPLGRTPTSDYENEYARWLAVSIEKDIQDTVAWLCEQKSSVDWMIVDHYGLDEQWERAVRPFVGRIMVIDDLADRRHDCDLLLDQNYFEGYEQRYEGLVPDYCRLLLGPKYALLRSEFVEAREQLRTRSGDVKHILVFLGGVDPSNETGKAVAALAGLERDDIEVDVVIGGRNLHKKEIQKICFQHSGIVVHEDVENMAQLMLQADLAIGAGGTTTWERCFLGLPTITILIAENQRGMIEALVARGATINAGWHADLSVTFLSALLVELLSDRGNLAKMETASLEIMGARNMSTSHPIVDSMLETIHVTP